MEINERFSVVYLNAKKIDTEKIKVELSGKYNLNVTIKQEDLERKPNYMDITRTY